MTFMGGILDISEDTDEPWFSEPKDKLPGSEIQRQRTVLAMVARLGPAVDVVAIPNAGKSTEWERIQRWKEGARAGALDLKFTWKPTRADDRGVFFAEMKDGKSPPTPAQIDRLNRYYRMGHNCGVYRTAACLVDHLRKAGAPIRDAII